jgi:tape measure domain-containing protein
MADFNVDVIVDPRKARTGSRQVRRELQEVEKSADKMRKTIARAFAFVSVGLAVRQLIQLTDTFTKMQNRLRTVVTGQQALNKATEELFQVAQRTRSSFEGTVELYARVGLAAKELGVTQQQLSNFTESLNQAIILSGASGQEAQAGLIQLSQGLASGALRGDELRSVLEQLPAVADVIAKELGVTRGQLRELGAEGKISADIVLDAFKNARGELADRFAKTVPTVSQAFQVLRNSLVRAAAGLAIVLGTALAAKALPKAIAGMRALTAAMVANPIGILVVALTTAIALLTTFSDQIEISADGLVTLRDYGVAAFQLILQYVGPLVTAIQDWLVNALHTANKTALSVDLTRLSARQDYSLK